MREPVNLAAMTAALDALGIRYAVDDGVIDFGLAIAGVSYHARIVPGPTLCRFRLGEGLYATARDKAVLLEALTACNYHLAMVKWAMDLADGEVVLFVEAPLLGGRLTRPMAWTLLMIALELASELFPTLGQVQAGALDLAGVLDRLEALGTKDGAALDWAPLSPVEEAVRQVLRELERRDV